MALLVAGTGGSGEKSTSGRAQTTAKRTPRRKNARPANGATAIARRDGAGVTTGRPGTRAVPILMYHVIAAPPAGAPFPGLYVPPAEFAEQMRALKGAGWTAVTPDELDAYWRHGISLPRGKPIVLSFDNGYQSQYTRALPVLRKLGWPAEENIQLAGSLPRREVSARARSAG